MKYTKLPAISGPQLIKLLKKDNWIEHGYRTHGISLIKRFGNRTKVTIVPSSKDSLPIDTLMAILGPKQTGIGKKGLLELLNKYS